MNKVIDSFFGEFRFLSNFWLVEVELDGLKFPSVENAYQAAKTLDKNERQKFVCITPGQAKRAGSKLILREDWESVKLEIMKDLNIQKFNNDTLKNY